MLIIVLWAAKNSHIRVRTCNSFCCAIVASHMAYLLLPGSLLEFHTMSEWQKITSGWAAGTAGEGVPQGPVLTPLPFALGD